MGAVAGAGEAHGGRTGRKRASDGRLQGQARREAAADAAGPGGPVSGRAAAWPAAGEPGVGQAGAGREEAWPAADESGSWPVTGSELLASGRIVRLRRDSVRLPDGQVVGREVVEHPGAVAVVALDDQDRVLLIRQYRHPVAATLWELPAGLRDVAGESLLEAARRELREEAGYHAADWHLLTDYLSSPGISTERIRLFLARDLAVVPDGEDEYVREHEEAYLTAAWVPLSEAISSIQAGQIHNGVAILGILSAYVARGAGFRGLRPADERDNW